MKNSSHTGIYLSVNRTEDENKITPLEILKHGMFIGANLSPELLDFQIKKFKDFKSKNPNIPYKEVVIDIDGKITEITFEELKEILRPEQVPLK